MNKKEDKDLKKREEEGLDRCIPVAKKIIKIITNHDYKLGVLSDKEKDEVFDPIAKEVIQLMVDKDLLYLEKDLVFQLVFQALEETKNKVVNSLHLSWELAVKNYFDGKDIVDLTLKDLDSKMRGTKL